MKFNIGEIVQVRDEDGHWQSVDARYTGPGVQPGTLRLWMSPGREFVFKEEDVRPDIDAHPDSKAVDVFAKAMKEKLYQARLKGCGGWERPEECPIDLLAKMLLREITEGDPIDVANLAMMLFMRKAKPEVLSFAARDFQERMAAPLREELEDIKQACIDVGCTDPEGEYIPSAMSLVEELRQRTVCQAAHHPLDDVPEPELDAFVTFCVENDLDRMFRDAGLTRVWEALAYNNATLL